MRIAYAAWSPDWDLTMTFLDLATTGGCLCRACGVRVATAYEHRFIVFLTRRGRRHGTTSGAAGERNKTGTDPCSDGRQPTHRSPCSSARSACTRSVGCSSTVPTMSGTACPLRFRRIRPHRTARVPGARGFLLPHSPLHACFCFDAPAEPCRRRRAADGSIGPRGRFRHARTPGRRCGLGWRGGPLPATPGPHRCYDQAPRRAGGTPGRGAGVAPVRRGDGIPSATD